MDFFIQQTINGVTLGSVFALYALGFSLVLANLRIFHVAHAAIFTWGAIACWHLTSQHDVPLALSLPLAAIGAGILNVLTYLVLIRHLERRRNNELAAFVSSLGGLVVLKELAAIDLKRDDVQLPFDTFPIQTWHFGDLQVSSIQVLIVGVAVMCFILLRMLIDKTNMGRQIQTVAYDRELASLLGIRPNAISMFVFFVSGFVGGVSAILVGVAFNVINADLGSTYTVLAIAVIVIGGLGRVGGTFAGGLIVGLAASYTTAYISSSYRDVVVYALLLAFLIIRPTGLFHTVNTAGRA